MVNAFRSGLDGQRSIPAHALIRRAAAMKSSSFDAQSHLSDLCLGNKFARFNKLAHSLSLEESRRRQRISEAAAAVSAASQPSSITANPSQSVTVNSSGGLPVANGGSEIIESPEKPPAETAV